MPRADRESERRAREAARAAAAPYAVEPPDETERRTRLERLKELLGQRIVLLDGAMGTMIQQHRLDEHGYRGERFRDHGLDLKGNNDILTLTRPEIVSGIHRAYFEAGADIIETNTFNSNAVSQADYGMQALVPELNYRAARLARAVADECARASGAPRFVAGALGPSTRMCSLSPDVNDPGYRSVTFDELRATYMDSARALVLGGVDLPCTPSSTGRYCDKRCDLDSTSSCNHFCNGRRCRPICVAPCACHSWSTLVLS